jgi:hypothetical protein
MENAQLVYATHNEQFNLCTIILQRRLKIQSAVYNVDVEYWTLIMIHTVYSKISQFCSSKIISKLPEIKQLLSSFCGHVIVSVLLK